MYEEEEKTDDVVSQEEEQEVEVERQKDKPKEQEEKKSDVRTVYDEETGTWVEVDIDEVLKSHIRQKNLEEKTKKSKHRQAIEEEKQRQSDLLKTLGLQHEQPKNYAPQQPQENTPDLYQPLDLPEDPQLPQMPTIFQGLPQEMQKFEEGGESGCPQGYYWNGKACVPIPKGAKVVSDITEYNRRKQAYVDSLTAYNTGNKVLEGIKNALNSQFEGADYSYATTDFIKNPFKKVEYGSNSKGVSPKGYGTVYEKYAMNATGRDIPRDLKIAKELKKLDSLRVLPFRTINSAELPLYIFIKNQHNLLFSKNNRPRNRQNKNNKHHQNKRSNYHHYQLEHQD